MKYKVNANNDKVKIFNSKFVNNNKTKCKIIYNNKEYYLCDLFQINNNDKEKGTLEIKLVLCIKQIINPYGIGTWFVFVVAAGVFGISLIITALLRKIPLIRKIL